MDFKLSERKGLLREMASSGMGHLAKTIKDLGFALRVG